MMARHAHALLVAGASLALAACSLVPRDGPPALPLPASYSDVAPAAAEPLADWWRGFGSAELDAAIAAALAGNPGLEASVARIEQARANLRIAGADLFPTIGAGLDSTRSWVTGDGLGGAFGGGFGNGGFGGGGFGGTTHQGRVNVSYEPDLFGRIRAGRAAAAQRYAASHLDRAAVELLLLAEVADGFVTVTSLRERLAIARANLDAERQVLGVVEARLREGKTSRLEVAQQRTAFANAEAAVAALEQQLRDGANALAVLQGVMPDGAAAGPDALAALTLPAIAPGQPALLLTRRPDLQRAEAELAAANADIGAARAALLPSLSLSGSGNFGIDPATTIGSLAAALAAPIFQGGRLQAGVELSQARRAELVANYREAVLTAVREVEDALNAVNVSARRRAALAVAAREAASATRLARQLFLEGRADFLTLLTSQAAEFRAEDAHAEARRAEFSAAIALYRALGGGWSETGATPTP